MNKMSKKSLTKKIADADVRIIFVMIFIVTALPLLMPIGLPIPISEEVRAAYDTIDALPPGSIIIIGNEFTAPSWTELGPAWIALMKQVIKNDIRFVMASYFYGEPPIAFTNLIQPKIQRYLDTYEYGVDWCDLGFLPGGESSLAAFASNVKFVDTDRFGNKLDDLEIFDDIHSLSDFALCLELDPGARLDVYLRQFQETYGLPFITITYGVTKAAYMPYMASGQLSGMMAALSGGAEYEQLVKEPGVASAGMDAVSTSHMFAALLLILGNVLYVYHEKIVKKEEE